jgi:hypothetical protein
MTRVVRCPVCKGQRCFYIQRAFGVEVRSCIPCAGKGWLIVTF